MTLFNFNTSSSTPVPGPTNPYSHYSKAAYGNLNSNAASPASPLLAPGTSLPQGISTSNNIPNSYQPFLGYPPSFQAPPGLFLPTSGPRPEGLLGQPLPGSNSLQTSFSSSTSILNPLPSTTYKITVAGVEGPVIQLAKLDRVFRPNLDYENWIQSFTTLSTTRQWTTEESLLILKMSVDPSLTSVFESATTLEEALDSILAFFFPSSNAEMYRKQLETIKASSFSNTQEYLLAFNQLLRRINLCLGNEPLNQREVLSYFHGGLDPSQIHLLATQTFKEPQEIANFLDRVKGFESTYNTIPTPGPQNFSNFRPEIHFPQYPVSYPPYQSPFKKRKFEPARVIREERNDFLDDCERSYNKAMDYKRKFGNQNNFKASKGKSK